MRRFAWFVILAAIVGCRDSSGPASQRVPADSGQPQQGKTIAVLDFRDRGPSVALAPLRIAFAEMLTSDLAQYEGLHVVERVRVDQFLREADLQAGFTDRAIAERAGEALAAQYLIAGSFAGKDQTVTIEASLFKVGTETPLAKWKESVGVSQLSDLPRKLVPKVLAALGMEEAAHRAPPEPRPGPSPTTAVLALRNLSPSARLEPMETGFAEILQVNLSALKDVTLVERQQIADVLKEQQLTVSGLADPQTALQVGQLLGAERLIYGSFVELEDQLRLDLRLVDTETTSILRTETASGPTEDFAELIEDLAIRLAVDLSIEPTEDADELVKASTPTRRLETALHLAAAERSFLMGRYTESAENYERALLVEPKNAFAGVRRVHAWYHAQEYQKAVEAGEHALSKGLAAEKSLQRRELYWALENSYFRLQQFSECARVIDQWLAEFPDEKSNIHFRVQHARMLMSADRRAEAVAMLEDAVQDEEAQGDSKVYAEALQTLLHYYVMEYQSILQSPGYWEKWQQDAAYREEVRAQTKQNAERARELLDLVLDEAAGKRDQVWASWARLRALSAVSLRYIDEEGRARLDLLDAAEKEQYLVRMLDVFSWEPRLVREASLLLAKQRLSQGKLKEAIEPYRDVLKNRNMQDGLSSLLPDPWDLRNSARTGASDTLILALVNIATSNMELENTQDAIAGLEELVKTYGVAHHRGVNAARALHDLGKDLQLPEKAALVWGGGDRAYSAWTKILDPFGYAVHPLLQDRISIGNLTPYSLVILVRTGRLPYTPNDILAIRSYVATGGSLLVVVSPGWDQAAPGIHNPLLSFFDMKADQEMVVRAQSTRLTDHPITKGITTTMTKDAVNLEAPPETVLIEADDQTVLAATRYRQGRVVVASFAQWFLPDPAIHGVMLYPGHPAWNVPRADLPLERGEGLQLPLLRNVVSWLLQPDQDDGDATGQRKQYVDAVAVSLQYEFQTVSREALSAAVEQLVANAQPGIWKEEVLWAAGESSLMLQYFGGITNPSYSWRASTGLPAPAPEYYQRLIDEFPDSPLRPYAQWRLADCRRRILFQSHSVASDLEAAIAAFEKVEAEEGSYAWAWTQLRLGVLRWSSPNAAAAVDHFKAVAERMDHGPEKSLGLLQTAVHYEVIQDVPEARRYYELASSVPPIYWTPIRRKISGWAPKWPNKYIGGGTDWIAKQGLARLQRD